MFTRTIAPTLMRYLRSFSAVLLTGSRQVGKTTLVKDELLKKQYDYVLLEDPDQRNLANLDPRRFLEQHPSPVIYDEFQHSPQLVNYLQGLIDQNRKEKGRFVLTGSQNFMMMEQISQSLAGRVGVLVLYGLNSLELPQEFLQNSDEKLGYLLLRGTYPELWAEKEIQTYDWYASYVQTYLERDVRRLTQVGDLASFERFIRVCAARTAQAINYSDIASDSGISPTTVVRWLSVLEATYLIQVVQPYHANLSSRIKKAPKLYFMDTGLAAYLMGFKEISSVIHSPQYGALFETLVYSNLIKKTMSLGERIQHFYLQTKSRIGVDFILEREKKLELVEIKGAKTFHPSMIEQLVLTAKEIKKPIHSCVLIGPFEKSFQLEVDKIKINVKRWFEL